MKQKNIFGQVVEKPVKPAKKKQGPKVRTVAKPINKSVLELINRRQRQMLVHSYLYYERDESLISDYDFDTWAFELVALRQKYPREFNQSDYKHEFRTFDGSTGFDLPYRMPNIAAVGNHLIKISKGAV